MGSAANGSAAHFWISSPDGLYGEAIVNSVDACTTSSFFRHAGREIGIVGAERLRDSRAGREFALRPSTNDIDRSRVYVSRGLEKGCRGRVLKVTAYF